MVTFYFINEGEFSINNANHCELLKCIIYSTNLYERMLQYVNGTSVEIKYNDIICKITSKIILFAVI